MRLSKVEKQSLEYALEGTTREVFLFGSRTDDTKKGGDIDILVYSPINPYWLSKQIAVRFFSRCESKIDVLVVDPGNQTPEQKAFILEQTLVKLTINHGFE